MAIEIWRPRGMAHWHPFREVEDINRYWDEMLGESMWPARWMRSPALKDWVPSLDVFERNGQFVVKAEVPGMDEKDINVSVEGDSLVIKGEKKAEKEVKDEDYYRCESSYGSFYRSLPLPSAVDRDKIKADYDNGVLEVSFPKIPQPEVKKVKVTKSEKKTKANVN